MKRVLLLGAAALTIAGAAHAQVGTGRQLDVITLPVGTASLPSQGGEEFEVRPLAGIFWDDRCVNVEYTYNTAAAPNDQLPGAPVITNAQTVEAIQNSLDRWNENPSSYIEMNVTNSANLGARPRVSGDFINEVTFITPGGFEALASSPSTSLLTDATFVAGADIDGDGDSDVFDPAVEGVNVCSDVDGDGDIEFPAGDYRAGTILDNDVQFSETVLWELGATDSDAADIDALAAHEFGHSHGLSHSLLNQVSGLDGRGSVMFPFIDIDDGASETVQRTLHVDDLAQSAFLYPEGSGNTGAPALQSGDVAFERAFAVITGSVADTEGVPFIAANVAAVTRQDEIVADTYAGTSVIFQNAQGGLFAFPESRINGDYTLPVPTRSSYRAALQAIDGDPAAPNDISTHAIVGSILNDNAFPEEFYDLGESNFELRPGSGAPFFVSAGNQRSIDFIVNEEIIQANGGPSDFIGFTALFGATSVKYVEMFDRAEVLANIASGSVPVSGNFNTGTADFSRTPLFSSVQLAVGRLDGNGVPEITDIIRQDTDFVGQDGDSTPFTFSAPGALPFQLGLALRRDPSLQVFLILEGTNLTAGPSGFPPAFVAFDSIAAGTVPTIGSSFFSVNDGPLVLVTGGVLDIQLRYVNDGGPVNPFLAGQ